MKITKISVKKFENDDAVVKGLVEVTLNNCFVIKDIRIIEKPEKMVVAMPSKTVVSKDPDENGNIVRRHKDLAHPINQKTRQIFNETILGVFERATTSDYEEDVNIVVCED